MQKLSYRDRIIVLVVLVILIIVVGVMLLIKPKFEDISAAEGELSTVQAQWDELDGKIKQVDSIKERVQKKYNESVEIGSLFVDIKRAYTLERFIQEYIDKNGIYINTNASFSDPSIVELTPYTLESETLDYPIGQSANLSSDETSESENTSGESEETEVENQSLPCGTITIDYNATRAGLMQFMQDIKDSGKSIEIKSISINNNTYNTFPEAVLSGDMTINVYYAQMISDVDIGREIEATEPQQ